MKTAHGDKKIEEPLTATMLAAAPPQEQKQMLGERLFPLILKQMLGERFFPLIQRMFSDLAGKITGMLLEIDNAELFHMLEDHGMLKGKVEEAVAVLRAHQGSSEIKESATRVSVSCQAALDEDEKSHQG